MKMFIGMSIIATAFLAAGVLADTCTDNTQCSNPTPICTAGICEACTLDTQCSGGTICQSGSCVLGSRTDAIVDVVECIINGDCASNKICLSNVCTLKTCGVTSNTPLNFGTVAVGQTSAEKTVTLTYSGNAPTYVLISGTDWSGTSFPVIATHYSLTTPVAYDSMTPLTTSPTSIDGPISIATSLYFKLKVPTIAAGTYTQTITFTGSCDGLQ